MISGYGNILGIAKINLKIFKIKKEVLVFVIDGKNFDHNFLVGLDLISAFRLCQNENLQIFQKLYSRNDKNLFHSHNSAFSVNSLELKADLGHLSHQKLHKISKIIQNFNEVFARDKYDVGQVKGHEATVKLSEHRYIYRKPYRCNIIDQKEIENQVSKLLEAGLIEESTSPFAAPVTLQFKRQSDGSKKKNRLCIDYTALNKIVVPESQPFPLIEDLIVKARDCTWYSLLDVNSAFWSIPLREKDRYKTAFVTQTGHYNWRCLPFGLKTSPAIFQRILRNVLKRNDLDEFSVNYIDDILVFSKTFEEHLAHLEKLLRAIHNEGFRLSLAKCNFAQKKITYLGHIIENNCIRPKFDNVLPVRDFPQPKNQKQIRQFLGKVNFYHTYIPNSAKILAPLHNLLRKNVKFNWDDKCEESFTKIKNYLCNEPCLAIFCPSKETVIHTDASGEGLGAVLKQKQLDGSFKPVAYFSKKLNETQKLRKATFLECLAIKEALMYWRHRLLGLNFTVFTDHQPLAGLNVNTKFDEELRELLLHISQFNCTVVYLPGARNLEADCFSRNPVLEANEATEELKVVNHVKLDEIINDQEKAHTNLSKKIKIINENNVLFTVCKDRNKIIISDEFAENLVKKVHLKFGHIGIKQVEMTVYPYFWNQNFKKIIKNFCHNCQICIKNKSRIPYKYGHLSQLGPATKPFEYMSIDTIGGFAGNNSTKKYCHLLVDHFTRYAYAVTSKHQKADDFIKLLNLVYDKGHKIENLLADQYTGINSNIFKNFLQQNGTRLLFTAVDCPFSNGLNERLNQTLVNRLRCKANENSANKKRPWSILLQECVAEYNDTIHTTTKFTPNYLLHGLQPNLVPELKLNVNFDLPTDRLKAFQNSMQIHNVNRKQFNKNRKIHDFKIGDLVYVNHGNPLNKNKLDEIRTGPFPVVAKISNVLFQIDSGYQKNESNIYHVSKMYPFVCHTQR